MIDSDKQEFNGRLFALELVLSYLLIHSRLKSGDIQSLSDSVLSDLERHHPEMSHVAYRSAKTRLDTLLASVLKNSSETYPP